MTAAARYPDLSGPCPVFMFGSFDGRDVDPNAADALKKALLRIQEDDRSVKIPSHRYQSSNTASDQRFMFGVAAEQPRVNVPANLMLNLWLTEQP
jgi:hypothetical protein